MTERIKFLRTQVLLWAFGKHALSLSQVGQYLTELDKLLQERDI